MRRRIRNEGCILLLSAIPVLVQYGVKDAAEEPGVLQVLGGVLLVYGLVLIVRGLFWVARRR